MSTVQLFTAEQADDATQTADGTTGFNNSGNAVDCISHTTDDAVRQHAGYRFDGVTIAAGDTINSSTFSGWLFAGGTDDPNCDVYAHKVANSPTFTSGANDIVGRDGAKTTNTVAWVDTNLYGAGGPAYYSPADISALITEMIAVGGWSSGNPISILLWGKTDIDNRNVAPRSYDFGTAAQYPKLDIDYTAGAAFVPYPRPRGLRAGMGEPVGGMQ